MYKVIISTGHKGTFKTLEEANEWIAKGVAGNWWGLPDRWTRNEGSETTRIVVDTPAREEHTEMVMQHNAETGQPTGEVEVVIPAIEEVSHTEYFYPAEYTIVEPEDITAEVEAKEARDTGIAQGAVYRKACNDALDYVLYYNVHAGFTTEQINQMKIDFSLINEYLSAGQPFGAKAAIEADNTPGYEDLKTVLLQILSEY